MQSFFNTENSAKNWILDEFSQKKEILQSFWYKRIVEYYPKSIEEFKTFIINTHFPKDKVWEENINALFENAVNKKIDLEYFYSQLKDLPFLLFQAMNEAEQLVKLPTYSRKESIEFTNYDFKNIIDYTRLKNISAAITLGNKELNTLNISPKDNKPFAIHSVGKVFTGILMMLMLKNGIITENDLQKPIALDAKVTEKLPEAVREHLSKVTLFQVMIHEGGLGDYLGKYFNAIENKHVKQINEPEDFLQFMDNQIYPTGENRYSNSGILLVGLAIKYAYGKKFGDTKYYDILQKYILEPASITTFSVNPPKDTIYNSEDKIAGEIAGSPAGGYWLSSLDLAKFGKWVYKECEKDKNLKTFIEKYGKEFYSKEDDILAHAGGIPSSSAYLYLSFKTGVVLSVLSDQPQMAFEIWHAVQQYVLSAQVNDLSNTFQKKQE